MSIKDLRIICVIVFFYIIEIIYYAAINAILIASVLYLSHVTTCSIHQMAPLLADWAICGGQPPAIVHFLNCFNNYSRFRYSYMYIMMFITYFCIFSDKLPSHVHTFGLLLILSRFIGLPCYSYQPAQWH